MFIIENTRKTAYPRGPGTPGLPDHINYYGQGTGGLDYLGICTLAACRNWQGEMLVIGNENRLDEMNFHCHDGFALISEGVSAVTSLERLEKFPLQSLPLKGRFQNSIDYGDDDGAACLWPALPQMQALVPIYRVRKNFHFQFSTVRPCIRRVGSAHADPGHFAVFSLPSLPCRFPPIPPCFVPPFSPSALPTGSSEPLTRFLPIPTPCLLIPFCREWSCSVRRSSMHPDRGNLTSR